MTEAETLFHKIAETMPDSKESKMFGALCIKTPNGKSGVMFRNDNMIFKLPADKIEEAKSLPGAKQFEASEGRPMNGWYQIPFSSNQKWAEYSQLSTELVRLLPANEKKPKKKK